MWYLYLCAGYQGFTAVLEPILGQIMKSKCSIFDAVQSYNIYCMKCTRLITGISNYDEPI